MWASKMAHRVKALEAILDYLSWIPGTNMMKERADSCMVSSDLHTYAIVHVLPPPPHFKLANIVNVSPSTLCYKSGKIAR